MAIDDGAQTLRKGRWTLTADTFERLLEALDPDRDRAAIAYERLRYRIIGLLSWWGAPGAEELADATLDRVARKLQEGAAIPSGSLAAYVRGVARLVFYESSRERLAPLTGDEPTMVPSGDLAEAGECLDRCLASWSATDRDLVKRRISASGSPMSLRYRQPHSASAPIGCGRAWNAVSPNA
jgi:hypothetical protein